MKETPIERYGRKLAHVVNMYLREVKPKGWHVDKELTPKEGIKILNAEHKKRSAGPGAKKPASSIQKPVSSIQKPVSSIQKPVSSKED